MHKLKNFYKTTTILNGAKPVRFMKLSMKMLNGAFTESTLLSTDTPPPTPLKQVVFHLFITSGLVISGSGSPAGSGYCHVEFSLPQG